MKFINFFIVIITFMNFLQTKSRENTQEIAIVTNGKHLGEIEISSNFTIREIKDEINKLLEIDLDTDWVLVYKTGKNKIYLGESDLNPKLKESNKLSIVKKNTLGITLNVIKPEDSIEPFPLAYLKYAQNLTK